MQDCDYNWLCSIEVRDVVKGIWSEGPNLPYAMCTPKAVTNNNESFSLVIGNEVGEYLQCKITILDEKIGFKEISTVNISTIRYCLTEMAI